MNCFHQNTVVRDELVDGIGPWIWVHGDTGAWDGPKQDWENHHKSNIIKYCSKFDVVLQAGGNCGMYPKLYSQMFKTVYTFEPDAMNFYCLTQNCQEHNIIKFQAALSNDHSMINMVHHHADNVGMHTVEKTEYSAIPSFTIDDLQFKTLDLIHLDIECFEEYALEGAIYTIEKHRPMLMLENGLTSNIEKFLTSLDYRYVAQSAMDAIWLPITYHKLNYGYKTEIITVYPDK